MSTKVASPSIRVLVVCLGNICRSPIGEAVLRDVAKKRELDNILVDSCGTGGWHVGENPDERTVAVCRKHKVPISRQARKLASSDYTEFTHILAADESNLQELIRRKPKDSTADIRLWGSYLDNKPIADPYYGGDDGFEDVFQQCTLLSNAFLDNAVAK